MQYLISLSSWSRRLRDISLVCVRGIVAGGLEVGLGGGGAYMYIYIYIYTCVCMYIYIYMYIYKTRHCESALFRVLPTPTPEYSITHGPHS